MNSLRSGIGCGLATAFFYAILAGGLSIVSAQPPRTESTFQSRLPSLSGEVDRWNGFERHQFMFEGRSAYIVKPTHPAPGNPWVWRARFPGFHAEADLILLKRGFHVAFLNTNGLLGSPAAMEAWDKFYHHAVELKLSKKVALEGVSRGGLFVYGFASRWPERVACLYSDTPVCDVKSWPGGFGAGKGSPAQWQDVLKHYSLNEQTAKSFRGSPIDRLRPIAEAKLPLLHIVSLNDTIVPPSENTRVVQQRLRELGHDLEVMEVAKGTEASNGHHFTHPAPVRVADFIERHASVLPDANEQKNGSHAETDDFFVRRGGLGKSRHVFENTGKGRVAFVGGSITNMKGWRELTMDYLQERFPETEFEFINAGIPSTGSVPGAFRLDHDVLSRGKIDLLLEEASVNDVTNGRTPEQMTRGMEGIVRRALKANPEMDVVMMHFVCPGHSAVYRKGKTPTTIARHEAVAQHYKVSSINLALEVTRRIDAGQFDWKNDFRNLHPSAFGHRVYAASIRRLLSSGWDIDLQALDETKNSVTQSSLPEPIDRFSYDQGKYLSLESVGKLNGFNVVKTNPADHGVGGGTRPGFTDVPMLVGSAGDSFELELEGRAIGIFIAAGPDAGVIEYSIDGGKKTTRDLQTQWSRGLHLPWVYVLADELDRNKKHRLQLKVLANPADPKKNACRIVQLLINE